MVILFMVKAFGAEIQEMLLYCEDSPRFSVHPYEAIQHPVSPSTFSWCQIMAADKYFWQGDTPRSRDFPITGQLRKHSGWPVQEVILIQIQSS